MLLLEILISSELLQVNELTIDWQKLTSVGVQNHKFGFVVLFERFVGSSLELSSDSLPLFFGSRVKSSIFLHFIFLIVMFFELRSSANSSIFKNLLLILNWYIIAEIDFLVVASSDHSVDFDSMSIVDIEF